MPKNTIYHRLIAKGYTDQDIRKAADAVGSSREFTLAMVGTPDGYPIIGIKYACDFRAEEEWGVGTLQKALGVPEGVDGWEMSNKNRDHVTRFELPSTSTGFAFALTARAVDPVTAWGGHIQLASANSKAWGQVAATGAREFKAANPDAHRTSEMYDQWWESSAPYSQQMSSALRIHSWTKLADLRDIALSLGIQKPGRTKAIVLQQITANDTPLQPDIWPGWFHNGDVFVLRADRGIVADVLEMLYQAASVTGTLAFGGGAQMFGSGLSLYDGRDVGVKLNRERKAYARWHKKALAELEPVEAVLKAKGHGWYALGRPTVMRGETHYWLNGHRGGPGYTGQPFGWYTLAELLDEKFVRDNVEYEAKKR